MHGEVRYVGRFKLIPMGEWIGGKLVLIHDWMVFDGDRYLCDVSSPWPCGRAQLLKYLEEYARRS